MTIKTLQIGLGWSSSASGGADRVFADLAASLPQEQVRFAGAVVGPADLSTATNGLIHSFAAEQTSTLTRLRGARTRIGQLIDRERPDLLASHFALYTFPLLDKLARQPFVMHFHGPWARESSEEGASRLYAFAKQTLERSVYRRAQRLIVLSHAFAKLLNETYGVPADLVRIVPGAVDLDRFHVTQSRVQARASLGWPTDRPTLFSVRRLVHRTGVRQLLAAMPLIRQRVPEVLLCIGGTGPLRPLLEQAVSELGIEDSVRFLGFVADEDLPLAYRAADISVVPTVSLEGFGLVAAESLACGTPTMVTPVAGLPEVVTGLTNDLIFPSGSPEDMAASLTGALLGKIKLPSEFACRSHATVNFSRSLMASRVAAVYRELC